MPCKASLTCSPDCIAVSLVHTIRRTQATADMYALMGSWYITIVATTDTHADGSADLQL